MSKNSVLDQGTLIQGDPKGDPHCLVVGLIANNPSTRVWITWITLLCPNKPKWKNFDILDHPYLDPGVIQRAKG
jgi:hypothetical protein